MEHDAVELSRLIGDRIRDERTKQNLTLDELAEQADLSRRMLVSVEKGEANPSVSTLLKLSDALGIGLPALVEPPEDSRVRVVRSEEGALLWSGKNGGTGVLVAGTEPPDVVELWDWTLEAGEEMRSAPHVEGTRELLYVFEGELFVLVEGETHHLYTGDVISFYGDSTHKYMNKSSQPVRFALTVFEPNVGDAKRKLARDAAELKGQSNKK